MARHKQAYLYSGPITPLQGDDSRLLFPGKSYRDLPDTEQVRNLIERRLLVAEEGSAEPQPASPKPAARAAANDGATA